MGELKKCPVTWAIIAVNAVMFLAVELTGGSEDVQNMLRWGAVYAPLVREQGQYYRLFTCMFLHFGLDHLGNNMLLLYFVGGHLERAVGKLRFLAVYLIGGAGASFISCAMDIVRDERVVSAGASGAVFAVIGGMIWILAANRGRLENLTTKKMIFMAVLALYFGFASQGVDNAAHVGGFVSGFVLALVLYRGPRRTRRKRQGEAGSSLRQ